MDASYDGSFGSFSAGGKDPGEGDFGGAGNNVNAGSNDVSDKIKLGRSTEDFNSDDLDVSHPTAGQVSVDLKQIEKELNEAAGAIGDASADVGGDAKDSIELKSKPVVAKGRDELYLAHEEDNVEIPKVEEKKTEVVDRETTTNQARIANPIVRESSIVASVPTAVTTPTVVPAPIATNTPAVPTAPTVTDTQTTVTTTQTVPVTNDLQNGGVVMNGVLNRNAVIGNNNTAGYGMMNGVNNNRVLVSVGANGISLPNEERKKSKKGLIIGAMLVVVLVIVGALVGLSLGRGRSGGKQEVVSSMSLKEAFNSYINYIWYGKDSLDDFDIDTLVNLTPYCLNMKNNNDEKDAYIANADEKYGVFDALYYQDNVGQEDITDIAILCQKYIGIPELTLDDIVGAYINGGYSEANSLIDETYKPYSNGVSNVALGNYIRALEEISSIDLEIVLQMNKAGCLNDDGVVPNCYSVSSDLIMSEAEANRNKNKSLAQLQKNANNIVKVVYNEVYSAYLGGLNETE